MTTYNHENFIAKAIDSVLKQKTKFNYEIIIGEDYSTDNTRNIVKAYKEKYQDKIRLFLPEKNLGMMAMTLATYSMCRGRYIAMLDGDDYWTDPLKLQKQVDFMENNPEYSFCFHNVSEYNELDDIILQTSHPSYNNADYSLIADSFIKADTPAYTLSVVFRNILDNPLPKWYHELPWGDVGLFCLLFKYGRAKYFTDNMGCYRVHNGGAYSGESDYANGVKAIKNFKILGQNLPYLNKKVINNTIAEYNFRLFKIDCQAININAAILHLFGMAYHDLTLVYKNLRCLTGSVLRMVLKTPGKYYQKLVVSSG